MLTYAIISNYWIFLSTVRKTWSCLLTKRLLLTHWAATMQLPKWLTTFTVKLWEQNPITVKSLKNLISTTIAVGTKIWHPWEMYISGIFGEARQLLLGGPAHHYLEFPQAFCVHEYLTFFSLWYFNMYWKFGIASSCIRNPACYILSFSKKYEAYLYPLFPNNRVTSISVSIYITPCCIITLLIAFFLVLVINKFNIDWV